MSAPLNVRKAIAASGDATEHGVKLLHRAIAPYPDSPAAALGEADPLSGGHESTLPFLRMVEHLRWTRLPQSESFSHLVHIPSEVWGKDSTVVTTGKFRSTNAGLGSPLLSLGMVEHFRWTGLPQSESLSRLVHIPSEVWGCRRVVADATRPEGRTPNIGTGVAVIMRKRRPEPSIRSPLPIPMPREESNAFPSPPTSVVPTLTFVVPAEAGTSTHSRTSNPHHPPSHTQPSPPPPSFPTPIGNPSRGAGWGQGLQTFQPSPVVPQNSLNNQSRA